MNQSLSQLRKEVEFQKMVEIKAFLMKPKHQCHLSQRVERVYGGHHEKKRDYYVNLSLSQLRKEV